MRELYKGRKIVVWPRRTRDGREFAATVNGHFATSTYQRVGAEEELLRRVRNDIDFIDSRPIGGWGIEWYDPKTVELCPEEIHAQPIGGPCPHSTCQQRAALPKSPCRKCGTPVGRYEPIGVLKSTWTIAHRAPESRLLCGASNLPDTAAYADMPDKEIKS